jgi:pSer/pThr/pTyr-binding forkhead associated (FHA) protein
VTDPATLVAPIAKGARSPYGDFVFVGRGSTSDIVLSDPSVSKSHAAFQAEGARWFVKDNRARNGTFVDGRRLEPGERVPLVSGVYVSFGAYGAYFLEAAHFMRVVSPGG